MYTEASKLIFILIAATATVGFVIGYFLFSMVRLHRNYLRIHEEQNRAKLVALEEERELISADLHDDMGPLLSAINFKLQMLEPVTEKEQTVLKEVIDHINGIFEHLRDISLKLAPRFLTASGVMYAVREMTSQYSYGSPLEVMVKPVNCEGLSNESALYVYRMMQEILNNTLKHSKANHLNISAEVVDNKLVIHTADDGVGFNPDALNEGRGLGLQNLELRARMIGAKLVRDTAPGKGARYTIEVPLNN